MKAIAINGSPRKSWNTATLLDKALEGAASVGAETERINLYDLQYKGCTSCFACIRNGSKFRGHCAMRDDLTPVLEKCMQSDLILLGSPIYLGDITSGTRAFLERLIFMNYSYEKERSTYFTGKINIGFLYDMNVPADMMKEVGYDYLFQSHAAFSRVLNGTTENLIVNDTCQFNDYSKYEASIWDAEHKAEHKKTQFPQDCEKAFALGARLLKA